MRYRRYPLSRLLLTSRFFRKRTHKQHAIPAAPCLSGSFTQPLPFSDVRADLSRSVHGPTLHSPMNSRLIFLQAVSLATTKVLVPLQAQDCRSPREVVRQARCRTWVRVQHFRDFFDIRETDFAAQLGELHVPCVPEALILQVPDPAWTKAKDLSLRPGRFNLPPWRRS